MNYDELNMETSYVCGLLELTLDNPERASKIVTMVPRDAFEDETLADIQQMCSSLLTNVEQPGMADMARHELWQSVRSRAIECIEAFVKSRCAYSLGAERFAWHVRSDWKKRLLSAAGTDLKVAIDRQASPAEVIAAARVVEEAAEGAEYGDRTPTLMDAVDEWLRMERTPVVPTGFSPIDMLCGGGLPLGGLFVVAAPPSVGKSALALQLTLGALDHDREMNAVWCMGEMTMEAMARRATCNWSARGGMHPVTMGAAERGTDLARGAGVNLAHAIGGRMQFVKPPLTMQKIEEIVVASRARLLVVDYVQLVELEGANDRRAEIDGIVKRVRRLSLEHNVATICLSNVSKVVSGDTRIGAIGKESSELDFAADLLLLGIAEERKDQPGPRPVKWACKKNRHGDCQDIETMFDGRLQTFTAALASPDAAFDDWSA